MSLAQAVTTSTSVTISGTYGGLTQRGTVSVTPVGGASISEPAEASAVPKPMSVTTALVKTATRPVWCRWTRRCEESVPVSLGVTAPVITNAGSSVARVSIYSPELQLIAETESASGTQLPIQYEYLWFAGEPVAQVTTGSGAIVYTFTDHLGTPIAQTDPAGAIVWRVETEPYGTPWLYRTGVDRYQALRFPGQESDPAAPEHSYNVFRWYRSGWGRYTQADPIGLSMAGSMYGVNHLYQYVDGNPLVNIDRKGLFATKMCGPSTVTKIKKAMSQLGALDLAKCVGCDLGFTASTLTSKMNRMTINCLETDEQGNYGITSDVCALAAKPSYSSSFNLKQTGSDITLLDNGLDGGCGCLPQLLLHEAGHLAAGRGSGGGAPIHQKIIDMAKKCVSCPQ